MRKFQILSASLPADCSVSVWVTPTSTNTPGPISPTRVVTPSTVESTEALLDAVCTVLAVIRRTKTEAKVSQRAEVEHVLVNATGTQISLVQMGLVDLLNAGVAQKIEFAQHASEQISTTVRLLAQ